MEYTIIARGRKKEITRMEQENREIGQLLLDKTTHSLVG